MYHHSNYRIIAGRASINYCGVMQRVFYVKKLDGNTMHQSDTVSADWGITDLVSGPRHGDLVHQIRSSATADTTADTKNGRAKRRAKRKAPIRDKNKMTRW